jgi:UMF1 family MFS transporter
MFVVFALPCLLLVRDRTSSHVELRARQVLGATQEVFSTIRHVREYQGLGSFLVARCLYTISLSTIGVFLAIYVVDQVGFTPAQMQLLSLIALLTAVGGSIAWGKVVDRLGPKRSLDLVLLVWAAAFAATAAFAYLKLPRGLFWAIGAFTGLALGGAPTADRPYLLRLSPPRLVGELYGLYATVGLIAAVVGPLLWTLVANGLGLGRPAAVLALLGCVVAALALLRTVSDRPRSWNEDERAAAPQLLPHRELEPLLDQSLPPTSREGRVLDPTQIPTAPRAGRQPTAGPGWAATGDASAS